MSLVAFLLALIAGVTLTVQIGANSAARGYLGGDALMATLVSFLIGSAALLLYVLLARTPWPSRSGLLAAPWWIWTGGLLGAFYVASSVLAGPRLGAALFLSLAVLGQLSSSIMVDHFGWLGFEPHPATLARVAGAVLMVAGVVLISR